MAKIKFAVWNMEWMNDLFDGNSEFHRDDHTVRGPNPGSREKPTVLQRRQSLSGAINEMELDILIVVEGPNKSEELQRFFDSDVTGTWRCDVQPTKGSSQIVGIAVRLDTDRFSETPFQRFHIGEGQGGDARRLSEATMPFLLDTDDDEIREQHRFERLPLYAQINTVDDKHFRVLGLHLKSKGVFDSLEWARWWSKADANRKKIVAQCRQLRVACLDHYLTDPDTRDIPLIVCGDINDGPGMDSSERRLDLSGVEMLMGTVWKPKLTLGNALYDSLDDKDRAAIDLDDIYTTSFKDPIFQSYRKVWIDHILYSHNRSQPWVADASVAHGFKSDDSDEMIPIWRKYPHASDHHPVMSFIETDLL